MTVKEQFEGSLAITPMQSEVAMQVQPTPMGVLQMAISQGADIDKLTKLMELQERWEANEARKAFNAAMAKFKDNPPKINKNNHVRYENSKGGFTEYDHATLDHVVDQIAASLSAVGISHKWVPSQEGSNITITCVLTHVLGHSEQFPLTAGPDSSGGKNAIQAVASTTTYLQRYTLLSATGMAVKGMDKDGRQPQGQEMDVEEFDRLCALIENAPNIDTLQQKYLAAAADAKDLGDKKAAARFNELKNRRYRELA